VGECWVIKGWNESLGWKKKEKVEVSEGERFLGGDVCMRSVLDLMIDGTVRRGGCLDGEEELCRVCWEMRGGVDVMEREGLVKEVDDGSGLVEEVDDGSGLRDGCDDGDGLEGGIDDGDGFGDKGDDGSSVGLVRSSEVGIGMIGSGEVGIGMMGSGEVGIGMMGSGEVGIGMMGSGEVGIGMMGSGEVGIGMMGSDEVDVGEGGINEDDGVGSESKSESEGESKSESGSEEESGGVGEEESGGVSVKRSFGVMVDEEQIVRDVRDGQRRVRMRMGEVEFGGVSRKERRMRLFGELVARVLKGGCVLCFWLGEKSGWCGENRHVWEDCKFQSGDFGEELRSEVKEIGKVGRDWSKRQNSGCNWCWLPKFVCNTWVENEKGSWISRRKIGGKSVRCDVRWEDVVCLGFLMMKTSRGGEEEGDMVQEWVNVRVGVYENGVRSGNGNDRMVWEWFVRRQLWCLRELEDGITEDEDEDGFCDFGGVNEGNRGWRDGIETNGLCCLLWKCRGEMWSGLDEMGRSV
jgi:hypothetical protein